MNSASNFMIFFLGAALAVTGCATSDPTLWPASPGTPTKTIYVSLDNWHAMIGFQEETREKPEKPTQGSPSSMQKIFEEWGYAEREWYLEGRQGFTGVLRALFWPSEGVVEVAKHNQLWARRTSQLPSDLFEFELSEGGYNRLRSHLQSTKASVRPVKSFTRSTFFPATDSYHVFHHCHQYVAGALQKAGLPVSIFWAITRTGLAHQLQEVQESIEERAEN